MLITPGAQPAQTLAAALATPRRDLVLVVDQLEELFTATHAPAVVAGFLDQVVRLAESGQRVVLVVRADQLGGFTRSPAAARLVEQGLHLVTPMTGDELREAIDGPARQAGLRLEPGLVELLVREVAGRAGRAAAAVPRAGRDLGTPRGRRADRGRLPRQRRHPGRGGPVRGGDVGVATRRPAGRRAGPAAAAGHPVPRRGTRRRPRLRWRRSRGDPARERVLDLLVRCRLVTTDEKTVTLAHEALARAWPRLRSWLDEDAAGHCCCGTSPSRPRTGRPGTGRTASSTAAPG